VLTKVRAYSSWHSAPILPFDADGRAETDFIQIRNIDGLNPAKASVSTSLYGSVDGASLMGSGVGTRNIVLTVHPNPDWLTWSFESLRRLIYSYFMPKRDVRLVFESDEIPPVEITGVVEDVSVNMFSKDQEFLVSIICPDPYFITVDPVILTGQANEAQPRIIDYGGDIETGFNVKVSFSSGASPTAIEVQIGVPIINDFVVKASVNNTNYFNLNSIKLRKYVQNINTSDGTITSLLSSILEGSTWPMFQPGENEFLVKTDLGIQDWELTYYERYGGL
jgi:hypothetical protein